MFDNAGNAAPLALPLAYTIADQTGRGSQVVWCDEPMTTTHDGYFQGWSHWPHRCHVHSIDAIDANRPGVQIDDIYGREERRPPNDARKRHTRSNRNLSLNPLLNPRWGKDA